MKIALVGSWNLADGYLGAAEALRRLGHEVFFIPAQKYFSESRESHLLSILKDLTKIQADVVLWWRAETLNFQQLKMARHQIPGKFIMYSWDDPFQWESHIDMPMKAPLLDVAYTCCMSSVKDYERWGTKRAVYCPPGFDKNVHYPDYDPEYVCDVSIVCTNFYHGNVLTKYEHLSRKDILNWIIDLAPNLDLRIYGPESFSNDFPNHYRGWIPFDKSRKVFSSSKINLCTHIRPDGDMYINERVTQILGSKGLLLVDNVKGINSVLAKGSECLVMNTLSRESFVNQINEIIKNYKSFEHVKGGGYAAALRRFTWDSWAKTIVENL